MDSVQQIVDEMQIDFSNMQLQVGAVEEEADQIRTDLTARADELRADMDSVLAEIADLGGIGEHDPAEAYAEDQLVKSVGKLYQALQAVPVGVAITDTTYWRLLGNFDSVGEAVAYAVERSDTAASDVEVAVETLELLGAQTPDGQSFQLNDSTVLVDENQSLAQWRQSLQTTFGDHSSRMDTMTQTQADDKQALTQAINTAQSTADNAATKAELTQAEQTLAAADSAQVSRIETMEVRMPAGTDDLATAQSVTQVSNRVDTVEGTVTTHSGQIATHTAEIAEKADSSTVSALTNTVSQQGDTLTAQGQQISGLSATVGGTSASINELREVVVSGNAIEQPDDPSFEGNVLASWNGGSSLPFQVMVASYESRSGSYALRIGWGRGFTVTLPNSRQIPVRGGEQIRIGFWARTSGSVPSNGAQVYLGLWYTTASGGYVDYAVGPSVVSNGVSAFSYREFSRTVTVPAGAANLQLRIVAPNWGSGWFHIDDIYLARPGAIISEMLAKYTLAVNAGGDVAGMQLMAGGGTSAIRFLSETVGFYSSDGAFEIANGRTITRSNGYMRVEGRPFGQNNEMVVWYGPEQANLADCRRNNAISFETNNGLHYSIGAMFSGTITAGGQTLAVAATTYSTGSFGTNGNPIAVNASFSHSRRQMGGMTSSGVKNSMSAGSGTTGATLELWRSIGGGAMEMVGSTYITGVMTIHNDFDPDIESYTDWSITGSVSYTDNYGGTANRVYEARMKNFTLQNVVISGSSPTPPPTNSRRLGVLTSE